MIQIREVVLVLWIFKSGNFFLAHPVESKILQLLWFRIQQLDDVILSQLLNLGFMVSDKKFPSNFLFTWKN